MDIRVRFGLDKVRELLSDEDNWTQSNWAVNSNGKAVEPDSPDACKWCLTSAIYISVQDVYLRIKIHDALMGNVPSEYGNLLFQFNDDNETTYSDVVGLIDKTIQSYNIEVR